MVLGSPLISEPLAAVESVFFTGYPERKDAVYVTGLARAGSTAMLQALHGSGVFASLTYQDMPFVLAPNLWSRLAHFHPAKLPRRERAHQDGLIQDVSSPEGLEEVFWRKILFGEYIQRESLHVHSVSIEAIERLREYQTLVCRRYGRQRYLAKNNNLILRLKSLLPRSSDTRYLVMFRHPAAQVASLLRQHRRFSEADAFTQGYMTWLVHHEFGATHRPFRFPGGSGSNRSPDSVDYWLERWLDAYEYLLGLLNSCDPNITPVHYERLCDDSSYRLRLFESLGVSAGGWAFKNKNQYADNVDPKLLIRAMHVYDELCARAGTA